MIVYGRINYTGTMKYNGSALNLEYVADDYKNGLTLTKGYIGGGYVSNAGWTVVTTIQNSTDAWGTSSNASLGTALRYGGWASAHTAGYMMYADFGSYLMNKKMSFSSETVSAIDNRTYGSNCPYFFQQGIGYNPDGSFYGTRAYSTGTQSTGYDILNFASDTWATKSDGNIWTSNYGVYCQAWFDKLAGFSVADDHVTRRYPFATETWGSITSSPAANSTGYSLSAWPKAVPTKDAKTYCHVGDIRTPIIKFMHITYSYVLNQYTQTLNNDEQSPVMGQNHGYYAGGYNGVQNAHTDRIEYMTDTVINIPDAPRALSSGSPMWSGY